MSQHQTKHHSQSSLITSDTMLSLTVAVHLFIAEQYLTEHVSVGLLGGSIPFYTKAAKKSLALQKQKTLSKGEVYSSILYCSVNCSALT